MNGVMNSSDCMFCFNVRNKRNCIGNLELPREKYLAIKQKLTAEFAETLSKEHSLPNLLEIVGNNPDPAYEPLLPDLERVEKIEKPELSRIESAFSKTAMLLFGKGLSGIDNYSKWLRTHVLKMEIGKSIISGKPILLADYSNYLKYPRNRLVTMLERISPLTYSDIRSGVAKMLRKLRDQTSSKNAIVTPCIMRIKKSQKRIAPRSTGTKSTPCEATVLRYLVRNPHRIISTAIHAKSGKTREKLPRIR